MKNNKSINVRVNEKLYNAIAADADAQQLSLNEIVRRVLQKTWGSSSTSIPVENQNLGQLLIWIGQQLEQSKTIPTQSPTNERSSLKTFSVRVSESRYKILRNLAKEQKVSINKIINQYLDEVIRDE